MSLEALLALSDDQLRMQNLPALIHWATHFTFTPDQADDEALVLGFAARCVRLLAIIQHEAGQ